MTGDWPERAACRADPELMHEETPARVQAAKRVCAGCPVRASCLTTAVDAGEPWGIWGGLTVVERELLRVGEPVRACESCDLEYVPRDEHTTRCCPACVPPARMGGTLINSQRETVTALTVAGWYPAEIAAVVGCQSTGLASARQRWRLESRVGQYERRAEAPCGTDAAARRHYRRGEKPCEACRDAERVEQQERRAKAGAG